MIRRKRMSRIESSPGNARRADEPQRSFCFAGEPPVLPSSSPTPPKEPEKEPDPALLARKAACKAWEEHSLVCHGFEGSCRLFTFCPEGARLKKTWDDLWRTAG